MNSRPEFLFFLGRFHVLLVHLPIGLIVLVAFLELLGRSTRFNSVRSGVGPVLALAAPVSIASAVCGWLLSLGGGYEENLLQLHKWMGIAVAAVCSLTALAYWLDLKKLYRLGVIASFLILVGASHFGGSLTHGKDYLTRYAPAPLRALLGGRQAAPVAEVGPSALAEKLAFEQVVKPLLDNHCTACHGSEKSKAGLRLDSLEAALKGGDNGAVIVPGKSAKSSLLQRVRLPPGHEDHMPPEGKPQPATEDLVLLAWWIDTGASGDKKIGELNPPSSVQRILETRFGSTPESTPSEPPTAQVPRPKPLIDVLPVAEQLSDELSISITALGQNEPFLQCNASLAGTNFGDTDLAKLTPLAANLRWLDLAGTRVTDEGLAAVATMRNLVRLHLERTAITDAGLGALRNLGGLEYLNLYGTAVTDAALETLKPLPSLRQVYLWRSQVTPAAAKAFAETRVDKAQLAQWEQQIKQLQDQIRNQRMTVEVGAPAATDPGPVPINTVCPVSSKPADRTKTLLHEGKVVAFCCDDCKASFEKDPKPHLAKLSQFASAPPGNLASPKPMNAKCPVSGKDVDPTQTTIILGKLAGFCCEKCKATFDQDPKPFLGKLGLSPADSDSIEGKHP